MSLSEDMSRLTNSMRDAHDNRLVAVSAMRAATGNQLAKLQAEHREMHAAQRKELEQFASTLRQSVSDLIRDLNTERATLSADQRRRLDAFTHGLRHDMADFLNRRAAERRAAGASQRQSLDDFMNTLRNRTDCFLTEAHATRMAIHADHNSAQQAWQQFSIEMRQGRTAQPMQPTEDKPQVESKSSAEFEQRDEAETSAEPPLRRTGKRRNTTPQDLPEGEAFGMLTPAAPEPTEGHGG